jgi:hypothetical protein
MTARALVRQLLRALNALPAGFTGTVRLTISKTGTTTITRGTK